MGPSRRALAKGVAWSLPVVVVATAAPAVASSLCPTVRMTAAIIDVNWDRLIFTNTSTITVPAGSTITVVLQNRASSNNRLTIGTLTGVTRTSGTSPITLAPNASTTFTFTVNAAIAPTGTVQFRVGWNVWNYAAYASVTFAGTALAACPATNSCASDVNDVIGSICPTGYSAPAPPASIQRAPTVRR